MKLRLLTLCSAEFPPVLLKQWTPNDASEAPYRRVSEKAPITYLKYLPGCAQPMLMSDENVNIPSASMRYQVILWKSFR